MEIKLNIYKDNGEIEKVYKKEVGKILSKTMRKLAFALDFEKVKSDDDFTKQINEKWDSLVEIMQTIFPDLTYEECDRTDMTEFCQCIVSLVMIIKGETAKIPQSKKK